MRIGLMAGVTAERGGKGASRTASRTNADP
jgi:hypothetical protein